MKRYFLRWFVPVILLFAMIAAAMFYYRSSVRRYAFELEISKVYGEIENGLGKSEIALKSVSDANYGVAVSLPLLDYQEDGRIIVTLLSNLKKSEIVKKTMAVDLAGVGYDDRGSKVDISGLLLFKELSNRFKDGGTGFLLVSDEGFDQGSVATVNSINFKNDKKGYLITIIKNDDLKEQLFGNVPPVFSCFYIAFDGNIIVSNSGEEYEHFAEEVWSFIPDNISQDVVKLSIVQKKYYNTEIEDYGFLMVIPSNVTNGAVLAVASDEEMNFLIREQMMEYYKFCFHIITAVVIYVFLCVLLLLLIRYFRRRRLAAFDEKSRRDPLTGVYSKEGLIYEIDKCVKGTPAKPGILFVVRVENYTRLRIEKGDTEADKSVVAFIDRFSMEFRVTDIVGRVGDDEYFVFLKDIREEKDVRKQIDEMHLLLHDIREEKSTDGEMLVAYAGYARFPGNGNSAKELIEYSEKMMEKAREEGNYIYFMNK